MVAIRVSPSRKTGLRAGLWNSLPLRTAGAAKLGLDAENLGSFESDARRLREAHSTDAFTEEFLQMEQTSSRQHWQRHTKATTADAVDEALVVVSNSCLASGVDAIASTDDVRSSIVDLPLDVASFANK